MGPSAASPPRRLLLLLAASLPLARSQAALTFGDGCCPGGEYCPTCRGGSCCTANVLAADGSAADTCMLGCTACPPGTYSPPGGFRVTGNGGYTCIPCGQGSGNAAGLSSCVAPPPPPSLLLARGVTDTLAGGAGGMVDGLAADARFREPYDVAPSADGTAIYVADLGNQAIRELRSSHPSFSADVVTVATLAGSGVAGTADGVGTSASFSYPAGLAADHYGLYLYVADYASSRIRAIDLSSRRVTTIAGSSYGHADGAGTEAAFKRPFALAWDAARGRLLVCDEEAHSIRAVAISPAHEVSTVAGSSLGARRRRTGRGQRAAP